MRETVSTLPPGERPPNVHGQPRQAAARGIAPACGGRLRKPGFAPASDGCTARERRNSGGSYPSKRKLCGARRPDFRGYFGCTFLGYRVGVASWARPGSRDRDPAPGGCATCLSGCVIGRAGMRGMRWPRCLKRNGPIPRRIAARGPYRSCSLLDVPGFDDWAALFLELHERQHHRRRLTVRITAPLTDLHAHNRARAVIDAGGISL